MSSNPNYKGDLGQAAVTHALIKAGYKIFPASSGSSPIDLIATDPDGHNAVRFQVKYRKPVDDKIELPFVTVINGKRTKINLDYVDAWAVYDPENDKIYFVGKEDLKSGQACFTFRIKEATEFKATAAPYGDYLRDPTRIWRMKSVNLWDITGLGFLHTTYNVQEYRGFTIGRAQWDGVKTWKLCYFDYTSVDWNDPVTYQFDKMNVHLRHEFASIAELKLFVAANPNTTLVL